MQRPLLDDRQCRLFLKSMREFGYPKLTFDDVRRVADEVHAGTNSPKDVISVMMCKQIDEAVEMTESER